MRNFFLYNLIDFKGGILDKYKYFFTRPAFFDQIDELRFAAAKKFLDSYGVLDFEKKYKSGILQRYKAIEIYQTIIVENQLYIPFYAIEEYGTYIAIRENDNSVYLIGKYNEGYKKRLFINSSVEQFFKALIFSDILFLTASTFYHNIAMTYTDLEERAKISVDDIGTMAFVMGTLCEYYLMEIDPAAWGNEDDNNFWVGTLRYWIT